MPDWRRYVREQLELPRLKGLTEAEIVEELAGQLEDCWDEALANGADESGAMAAVEHHVRDWGSLSQRLGEGEGRQRVGRAEAWFDRTEVDLRRGEGVGHLLADLGSDLRQTLRTLRRSPGFAFIAVLSLALGIGVNTAVFSIYSGLFLRDPPVQAPGELLEVVWMEGPDRVGVFSYPDFRDLRDLTHEVFTDLITYDISMGILEADGTSEMIYGEAVSDAYFSLLGITPEVGRLFLPDQDGRPEAPPVVVLGHQNWQNRFGSDPAIVGRTLRISGQDYTVVGVAPRSFTGMIPLTSEFWLPITHDPMIGGGLADLESRTTQFLFSVKGRLRPGVNLMNAQAAVDAAAESIRELHEGEWRLNLVPLSEIGIHPLFDEPIRLVNIFLLATVALVLLVACVNLAGMLLARATVRQKEVAVRMALGSSRSRLIRMLLTESLTLSVIGGLLGLLIAAGLIRLMLGLQPPIPFPLSLKLGLDVGVLAYTLILMLVTGLLFGLVPALKATRPDLAAALKSDVAAGRRLGRMRLRSLLVMGQVAVSTVLLIVSGLFLRSLLNVNNTDPGFALRQGYVAVFHTGVRKFDIDQSRGFFTTLQERVSSLPGVRSTSIVSALPLGPGVTTSVARRPVTEEEPDPIGYQADVARCGPGYFETMGIPLVHGRSFTDNDNRAGVRTIVVNQTLAERLWPGADPLGRTLRVSFLGEEYWEVVGVARDGKYRTLGEAPRSYLYVPWLGGQQRDVNFLSLVVATEGDPARYQAGLQETVRAIDPLMPVFEFKTIPDHLQIMTFIPRLLAYLLGGLGSLALLLGIVGLYGVISFDVARRTREVGIRIALGAARRDVLRGVVGGGLRMAGIGSVVGLALALLATRPLAGMLIGVGPADPVTYLGITLLLMGVAVAAAWGPARRAAGLDPIRALQAE